VTIAMFAGSFDPVHNGHMDVIERASRLFDELIVAAIRNPQKSVGLFDIEERKDMLLEATSHLTNVRIDSFSVLVVDFAKKRGVTALVRGLRAVSDFESELEMAQMNHRLSAIDTVFIPTAPEHSFIASRLLREVARYGGDVTTFVPPASAKRLKEKFA
jgi:pantetheine-phosphate adenylyltransferase